MLFRIDDTGPFWMTEAERDQKRHDLVLEGQTITRQYTKDELLKQQELKRLKQKLSKDGKINQTVCCGYFGSVDLLTNWDWRPTRWMESRMHLDLCRKTFLWSRWRETVLISRKRRHYCSQWEGKWEYLLTERRNVTVNLQERESSILGVAPRKFLPSGFSEEEKGKENSGLWCERACQQKKC